MDAAPHTTWIDGDEEDERCRAFCTCGWELPGQPTSRREANRLADLHQRNARRRALAVPLGDLDEDAIVRVLQRMSDLMHDGVDAPAALAQARDDEVHGRLGGQLIVGVIPPDA